jgi:AraC-like DNA-binding protein
MSKMGQTVGRSAPLLRSASLTGYAELATQVGLDPVVLLRRAGLSLRQLADPDTPVSALAVRKLLEASAAASGAEDFGLRLARTRRLSNLGPISAVMREASTAREAIEDLCRYMRLLNEELLPRIEEHDDVSVISEEMLTDERGPVRQGIEMAIGVLYRIIAELLGPTWKPRGVCFEHRPPHGPTIHKAMFGVAVQFNAGFNGIVCATKGLKAGLSAADSRLAPYARRLLDQALAGAGDSTLHRARQVVIALLPLGRCTADQVARTLGMDRRTLHRHLRGEGTDFSTLLRTVRTEFASRHVLDSDRSLAELADLLGFSSASAFAFWFRQNFGTTVSTWRKRRSPGRAGIGASRATA